MRFLAYLMVLWTVMILIVFALIGSHLKAEGPANAAHECGPNVCWNSVR